MEYKGLRGVVDLWIQPYLLREFSGYNLGIFRGLAVPSQEVVVVGM